ncbi:MSMEG_0570 family nitrogen starvation response protein [Zhongshania guokunii]|uniref:MSMEG_0570 family nitrogen starvation response protein n=1 Tax=Zhongshania guokunii TaxID=641783 RepID=A0ABV3U4B1_9GAMM
MPALNFTVRWPDGSVDVCYSPSTVLYEHIEANQRYSLKEFLHRSKLALNEASARVERKYGYQCSSAMDQLSRINSKVAQFKSLDDSVVEIISITT